MKWADAKRLRQSFFRKHPVVRAMFLYQENDLIPRYHPEKKNGRFRYAYFWWVRDTMNGAFKSPDLQYHPLWTEKGIASPVLVFFQFGKYFEFYGDQAEIAHAVLGLKMLPYLHGFKKGCGFHIRWTGRFVQKAIHRGMHVAIIRQFKQPDGRVNRRLVALIRSKDVPQKATDKERPWVMKARFYERVHKLRKATQLTLPF